MTSIFLIGTELLIFGYLCARTGYHFGQLMARPRLSLEDIEAIQKAKASIVAEIYTKRFDKKL